MPYPLPPEAKDLETPMSKVRHYESGEFMRFKDVVAPMHADEAAEWMRNPL